jgi:hypothetical protein
LRRMVSTYISPLGIAYTGLLAMPIAVLLINEAGPKRRDALIVLVTFAFLVAGILFSVTRLALLMLVVETALLAFILGGRPLWGLAALITVLVAAVLLIYPSVGPVVDPFLLPGVSRDHTILSSRDPSFLEHIRALGADIRIVVQHPLGLGLGGSVHRFVVPGLDTGGTGESAILGFFGDVGIVGGCLGLAMYFFGIYSGLKAVLRGPRGTMKTALPLVAGVGGLVLLPIALTSDIWGDFSVTFLFWWAVGYAATAASRTHSAPAAALLVAQP